MELNQSQLLAKIGLSMVFKDGDEPKRRWIVTGVGETRRSEQDVKAHERNYLKHREVTDI
jgi:hypothetical protein